MNLCSECRRTPWPFLFITFISVVVASITWMMLDLAQLQAGVRLSVSGLVFLAVAATLSHYVMSCMRRHCRSQSGGERA